MTHTDFGGGKFVKMSDIIFRLATPSDATDKRMSVPWRIWEMSLGRMNNWGHAGFERDELAALLICKPRNAVGRTERQMVWKYIKVLKSMGRIAPASTALCIVVRHDLVTRPRGKGGYDDLCCEAEHMRYRRMAWEPPTGWIDLATGVSPSDDSADQWDTPAPWNTTGVSVLNDTHTASPAVF